MSYTDDVPTDHIPPVQDFATDWDFNDPEWVKDPYPIWQDLRNRCPMAHSERFNEGIWLPLNYDDLVEIAHDTDRFSSRHSGIRRGGTTERDHLPPITSDPPEHLPIRRTLLPFFSPKRIAQWKPHIEQNCRARAQVIVDRGSGDAAIDYSQHIPADTIALILGIDPADGDRFRGWIDDIVGSGADDSETMLRGVAEIREYMRAVIAQRRSDPADDLISHLVTTELDGEPLDDDLIERMLVLQLVAGIDTTWSSIGAALWHLGAVDGDRRRLVAEPELIPTAIEELLRAYAPVNVTRRVTSDTEVNGVSMREGDHVMMTFPIACRDPEQFARADEVVIDRAANRHIAFGVGIHRCLGSNLARLEMLVAVSTWLELMPEYRLDPDAATQWSTGQIRGPRSIPIIVGSP